MVNKVDINEQNAKEFLIDESLNRLIVVDFWADWCAPCKSLMPILEKLADEYAGDFLLAKVNADEQQMLASQFGVRSLPTVVLMKDGQPIDGFTGALPESEIRALLDKHLPKPWDKKLAEGKALLEQHRFADAIAPLQEALSQSGRRADIACTLAEAYLNCKRLADAKSLLDEIKMINQDAYFEQVKAQLDLAQNASKAPEIDALEQRHQAEPDNDEVAYQLAIQYSQHSYHREALDILFALLQKKLDARDGDVRKSFNDVLAALGKGDPLAVEFQRKIYALLY